MSSKLQPWSSWQQWDDVRQLLLPDSLSAVSGRPASRSEGVQWVRAWRIRGKVPLSLDVTACLVEAQLQDEQRSSSSLSDAALRNMYAVPIIRLVNGVADAQQRGRVASSVASLAGQAGLPPLLVDIRHAATHNELPSLQLLRLAADRALRWLRTSYWEVQSAQLTETCQRLVDTVRELHGSWLAAHTKAGTGGKLDNTEEDGEEEEEAAGTEGEEAPAAYTSAHGKATRKAALSMIKSLVPGSWSSCLLAPLLAALTPSLLDSAAALPGAPESSGTEAGKVSAKKRRRSEGAVSSLAAALSQPAQAGARSGGRPADALAVKALTSCLTQILGQYPHLGLQMATLCMHSLASSCSTASTQLPNCSAAPHTCGTDRHAAAVDHLSWWPQSTLSRVLQPPPANESQDPPNTWQLPPSWAWAWLRLLLPADSRLIVQGTTRTDSVAAHKRTQGRGGQSAGSELSLQLSAAQLTELLETAVQGLSGSAAAGSQQDGGTQPPLPSTTVRQALTWVVSSLAPMLQSVTLAEAEAPARSGRSRTPGTNSDPATAKAARVLELARLLQPQSQQQQEGANKWDSREAATQWQQSFLSQPTTHRHHAHQQPQAPATRWSKVAHWAPAPVGCLPSACLPSGLVPLLTLPPRGPVEPPLAQAAGAAAHVNTAGEQVLQEQDGRDEERDWPGVQDGLGSAVDAEGLWEEAGEVGGQGAGGVSRCRVGSGWVSLTQLPEIAAGVRLLA